MNGSYKRGLTMNQNLPAQPTHKIVTTVMHDCRSGQHSECPQIFQSFVTGHMVTCLCKCHIIITEKGGE